MRLAGISAYFDADEIEALVRTAAEAVCGDLDDLSRRQVSLASMARALMNDEMDPREHEREGTTPMPDGTLLADCACGGTYSVPPDGVRSLNVCSGNEYALLERARIEHIKGGGDPEPDDITCVDED